MDLVEKAAGFESCIKDEKPKIDLTKIDPTKIDIAKGLSRISWYLKTQAKDDFCLCVDHLQAFVDCSLHPLGAVISELAKALLGAANTLSQTKEKPEVVEPAAPEPVDPPDAVRNFQ